MKNNIRNAYSDVLDSFIKCYFEVILYANVKRIFKVPNKTYKKTRIIVSNAGFIFFKANSKYYSKYSITRLVTYASSVFHEYFSVFLVQLPLASYSYSQVSVLTT